ncbi:hypothetical protein BH11ARM2_BH11ARM2_11980 [soil metagenome]
MKRTALCLALATMAAFAVAQTPAQKAFERLTKMKGTWEVSDGKQTVKIVYKLTGGGSSVVETQFPDTPMEMMTIYHMDGPDKLILTHYCAAQNQPTLKMVKGGTDTDFRFAFVSGTNMKPTDMHIHNVHYQILADDHVITEWEGYMNGKSGGTEKFDLHRFAS